MKKIILMFIIFITSINAYAFGPFVYLSGLSAPRLNNITSSSMMFMVSYPGGISGTCRLIIRAASGPDNGLLQLKDKFTFTDGSGKEATPLTSPFGLIFTLANGAYADYVEIKTKDGRSIQDNIASLFPNVNGYLPHVGIITGVCDPSEVVQL